MNNIKWIECNLPFIINVDFTELIEFERQNKPPYNLPNLENLERERFGMTKAEADKNFGDSAEFDNFLIEYYEWFNEYSKLPEVIKYKEEYFGRVLDEYDEKFKQWKDKKYGKSFYSLGLGKPGTLIEIDNGEQYLIGSSFAHDICFINSTIIKRYAVVFSPEDFNIKLSYE